MLRKFLCEICTSDIAPLRFVIYNITITEDLEKLGYNVYSRDVSNDMYKIENSKEFYLTNDTLYIIYAYGNDNFTSEIDLIVI